MKLELTKSFDKGGFQTIVEDHVFQPDDGTEDKVLNLYPEITYQVMEGFGGAITDAAGYVFSLMNEQQQEEVLDMYYSPENMNYTLARIHMDSCDFSTHIYSAMEDETDTELKSFSFADTERYIIPLLDAAEKKAGRKLQIMLSAWSPPPFMKTNGERKHGGSLKPEYRGLWAEYLCKYIMIFRERGYCVKRMSIQNEPKATQIWDSCVYTPQQEKEFLRDYLYPALVRHGLDDIEIYIWDHNKERLYERARDIIDDETDKMVTGVAFHWYSGDHFETLDMVKKCYPDKRLILSESCLELCKYVGAEENYQCWRLAHDMIGNFNHGMEAFHDWNILLNKDGGPTHVNYFCNAPYRYYEDRKELVPQRFLKYYWHFSHFMKPGASALRDPLKWRDGRCHSGAGIYRDRNHQSIKAMADGIITP